MQRPRNVRPLEEVLREFFEKNPQLPPEHLPIIKSLVLEVRNELTLARAEQKVFQENNSTAHEPGSP